MRIRSSRRAHANPHTDVRAQGWRRNRGWSLFPVHIRYPVTTPIVENYFETQPPGGSLVMCVLIKDLRRSGVYVCANKGFTGSKSRRPSAFNAEAQRKARTA